MSSGSGLRWDPRPQHPSSLWCQSRTQARGRHFRLHPSAAQINRLDRYLPHPGISLISALPFAIDGSTIKRKDPWVGSEIILIMRPSAPEVLTLQASDGPAFFLPLPLPPTTMMEIQLFCSPRTSARRRKKSSGFHPARWRRQSSALLGCSILMLRVLLPRLTTEYRTRARSGLGRRHSRRRTSRRWIRCDIEYARRDPNAIFSDA
jgi:hypothetical protein